MLKQKVNKAAAGGRNVVVIPKMGQGNMPDFDLVKQALEAAGYEVLNPDLKLREGFPSVPWSRVCVVALDNMRGSLTDFSTYQQILHRLEDEQRRHGFSFFPDLEAIHWIANKADYLQFLNDKNIPIIPTKVICTQIAQSDSPHSNLQGACKDILDFMSVSQSARFVLKPSTSALAGGLVFVEKMKDGGFQVTNPAYQGETPLILTYKSEQEFQDVYLKSYLAATPQHDGRFLFQEFIKNIETSAVFVNGGVHFVERTPGKESHIAHARYGGEDKVISAPDPELVQFVRRIYEALPEYVQQSPYLRIDVMKNTDTGQYILSEIEGAGGIRLWLGPSNRIDDYVAMIRERFSSLNPDLDQKVAGLLKAAETPQPPVVVIPRLGQADVRDTSLLKTQLKDAGFEVQEPDMTAPGSLINVSNIGEIKHASEHPGAQALSPELVSFIKLIGLGERSLIVCLPPASMKDFDVYDGTIALFSNIGDFQVGKNEHLTEPTKQVFACVRQPHQLDLSDTNQVAALVQTIQTVHQEARAELLQSSAVASEEYEQPRAALG